ncbi:uncharacterized protein LOC136028104 isoform X4 [Artemia franciscana]|uniref:uncharacterized protein LOC136028104 isoform X4 n=1 Tax=Artemia franciscana TaxID=6661 RepID=UPI0032DBC38B
MKLANDCMNNAQTKVKTNIQNELDHAKQRVQEKELDMNIVNGAAWQIKQIEQLHSSSSTSGLVKNAQDVFLDEGFA